LLLATTTYYPFLVVAQLLSGINVATIGVSTVLVITDLLPAPAASIWPRVRSGALTGIAASMSTSGTGIIFQELGARRDFCPVAVALAQTTLIWVFLAKTKLGTCEG
jgi:hypothetical protein